METKFYTVTKIEGEYAYILEENTENEIFIAMALLPEGVDIGTHLKYEMFSYEIVDQPPAVSSQRSDGYINGVLTILTNKKNSFQVSFLLLSFSFCKEKRKGETK